MRATLTFDLNDPDDRQAHLRAVKSLDLALALFTIQEDFRRLRKIQDEDEPSILLEEVFKIIDRAVDQYNVNLNEIIS